MKAKLFSLCLGPLLLIPGMARGQEMSAELFKKLVTTPGDTNALRAELAALPFWPKAKCSITMKYQDGKVFKEECIQTAKTISGKFIVFSMNSEYYKQTVHAIAGYDENACAIKQWGMLGDKLVAATMVFDLEQKVSAATSTYGEDFMELSVGSASEEEMSDRTLVYKSGVLFMTREAKTRPIKAERASSANAAKAVDARTNPAPAQSWTPINLSRPQP